MHLDTFFYLLLSFLINLVSHAQTSSERSVGGPCQGCEALYEYGNEQLNPIDTLPGFDVNHPKLKLSGTVFTQDGKTPASDVILYIYHTNRSGIYEKLGNEKGWGRKHGHIRGWVKTGEDGKYTFYTFRPASYPDRKEPEHIHITVKEPDKNDYYLEDFYFEDDPLLTSDKRSSLKKRGGSGIVTPNLNQGLFTVKRNIILGLNIPNYPKE